jgi:hypothetical protein
MQSKKNSKNMRLLEYFDNRRIKRWIKLLSLLKEK